MASRSVWVVLLCIRTRTVILLTLKSLKFNTYRTIEFKNATTFSDDTFPSDDPVNMEQGVDWRVTTTTYDVIMTLNLGAHFRAAQASAGFPLSAGMT